MMQEIIYGNYNKDDLKQMEFLAYLSLRNDLRYYKLAQSYLYYGELNL